MDLFDVGSGRFSVSGLGNTAVRRSYVIDAANYPYRVLMSAVIVARRLGLAKIADGFFAKVREAEKFIGLLTADEASELMARMRGRTQGKP